MIYTALDTLDVTQEQISNSPSQKDGVDEKSETLLRRFGCDLIQESGNLMKLGKKKRGERATGGEKNGKGLRHFSMRVCEKVESKGRTTYNEVADELVAEGTNPDSPHVSADKQQYDEKNIRRRVYDALNVLMAMGIILKDKKDIQWKGLPCASLSDVQSLKAEGMRVRGEIARKAAYLHELQAQMVGLRNLVMRNERLYHRNNSVPPGGVALPFILVQTRPQATVEVEISEDMQVVHFDFNSTPFELHDDAYVLKAMSLQEQQGGDSAEALNHTNFDDGLVHFEEDSPLASGVFQCSTYSDLPSSPYYASAPVAVYNTLDSRHTATLISTINEVNKTRWTLNSGMHGQWRTQGASPQLQAPSSMSDPILTPTFPLKPATLSRKKWRLVADETVEFERHNRLKFKTSGNLLNS